MADDGLAAIYDGNCGICDTIRRWCERHDPEGVVRWMPLQDDAVYRRYPALSRAACECEIHVVDAADGTVSRGYDGMCAIGARLPAIAWAVPVARTAPVALVGGVVYRTVAALRRPLTACGLPGSPAVAPPPAIGRGDRLTRIAVSVLIVAALATEVAAIATPFEQWPFTSNSMFSYYRTPDGPVYDIVVSQTTAAGATVRIDPRRDLGVPDGEAFRRMVFSRWYGSTDPRFPQGRVAPGSDAFVGRMTVFCGRVVRVLRRRGAAPAALTVEVARMTRTGGVYRPQAVRVIGHYATASGAFTLEAHQ